MTHDQTPQLFGMEADTYPLDEGITLSVGVAHFDNQLASLSTAAPDCDFLSRITFTHCGSGACDGPVYPFVCIPQKPFAQLPTAAQVLAELRATHFQSEHIASLDEVCIHYPGYQPGTKNDEIHTDPGAQYIFVRGSQGRPDETLEQIENLGAAEGRDEFEALSKASHQWLRDYVLESHLFYVLLHDKPKAYGSHAYSNFVLLFAVGVSPATGNLVGAVTSQACHNLCD